ncbi:MAG: hypothetical protein J7L07_04230 [Candidatus Odinarchaeota archaeon]|nr:hypothetical protein [Candidatus Odinarchaeota archaeon]
MSHNVPTLPSFYDHDLIVNYLLRKLKNVGNKILLRTGSGNELEIGRLYVETGKPDIIIEIRINVRSLLQAANIEIKKDLESRVPIFIEVEKEFDNARKDFKETNYIVRIPAIVVGEIATGRSTSILGYETIMGLEINVKGINYQML